jgi:predicted ATP-grasp superfamily ATP-dependent carboligase
MSTLPCVVLGLETQIGLNLVRELGRAGVRVIGVAQTANAIGLKSRYLWKSFCVSKPRSAELVNTLRSIGEQHGPCPLLSISEVNMLWLQGQAEAIKPLQAVLPSSSALAAVLDKQATLAAARETGIDIPSTWQPHSPADIAAQVNDFPLPAVLKWSDPNGVAARLDAHGLEFIKAEYVDTTAELSAALDRYTCVGSWPLVQQYCPGYGLGQFFFMKDGRAVRRFQHRRVAEWPPEGGTSAVADAVPLTEHLHLQDKSEALLRRIGWDGVAMVEYRHDPATGKSWLMEINGRFWGSFPLAVHCNAGFALLSYLSAINAELPALPAPRTDLRCRMVGGEMKRLHRIFLHPDAIADKYFVRRPWFELGRFALDYINPRTRYYVAALDDLGPLWADIRNVLRRNSD